jgi:hypothetical protein
MSEYSQIMIPRTKRNGRFDATVVSVCLMLIGAGLWVGVSTLPGALQVGWWTAVVVVLLLVRVYVRNWLAIRAMVDRVTRMVETAASTATASESSAPVVDAVAWCLEEEKRLYGDSDDVADCAARFMAHARLLRTRYDVLSDGDAAAARALVSRVAAKMERACALRAEQPAAWRKWSAAWAVQMTFDTNALEGSRLTIEQTRALLSADAGDAEAAGGGALSADLSAELLEDASPRDVATALGIGRARPVQWVQCVRCGGRQIPRCRRAAERRDVL